MKEIINLLKIPFKRYSLYYISGIFFLIVSTTFNLLSPQIVGSFINHITNNTLNITNLSQIIFILIIMMILGYGIGFLWIYLLYIVGEKYNFDIKTNIFNKIIKVDNDFFLKFKIGDILTRLTLDMQNITLAVGDGVYFVVESLSSIIMIVIAMYFTTNLTLTIIVIIPLLLLSISANIISVKMAKKYDILQSNISYFSSQVLQSIKGIKIIKAFNKENVILKQLEDKNLTTYDKGIETEKIRVLLGPIYRFFYGLIYSISIMYGIYLLSNSEINVGQLVAFNLYIGMLDWPIYALQLVFGTLQKGATSYKRINEIQEYPIDNTYYGSKNISKIESIQFIDYDYSYNKGHKILDSINLKINDQEKIKIVGKIGAGKSTLLRQLLMLYQHNEKGRILINGNDITDYNKEEYLALISYASQTNEVFNMSIKDNLLVGNPKANSEDILKALEHAALLDEVLNFENGLDTIIGENGTNLSGGQQQRLNLARALIKSSNLLLLDDVFSAVDLKTEKQIMNNLENYYSDRTIVLVTHRLTSIQKQDHILVLQNNKIIQEGSMQELLKSEGWFNDNYKLQEGSLLW
ncbi:ABC transporter ATP-binding protein [Mycoplasma sp. P36-A1]|uniref:ABC transporter ATP-binding protein n=1 Tax=Mycoplasma sp. P36-A1 TaxID=3252900 RepID=UPI003C2EC65F